MGCSDDYKKDQDRLFDTLHHDAQYKTGKLSEEALASWQKRGREVGIRFGDFYDRFITDPQKLLADIVALGKKRSASSK